MSLMGKRIAILVEQDFEDSELVEPLNAMKEAGADLPMFNRAIIQTLEK